MAGYRRIVGIVLAAALLGGGPVSAREASAEAFLKRVYESHAKRDGSFEAVAPDSLVQIFAPDIVRLLQRNRAGDGEDAGAPLLVDPLTGEPPGQPFGLVGVEADARGPGRASATVQIETEGRTVRIDQELVRVRGGWRIDDVYWTDMRGGSLRTLLTSP